LGQRRGTSWLNRNAMASVLHSVNPSLEGLHGHFHQFHSYFSDSTFSCTSMISMHVIKDFFVLFFDLSANLVVINGGQKALLFGRLVWSISTISTYTQWNIPHAWHSWFSRL
jgi:hypothetical protein